MSGAQRIGRVIGLQHRLALLRLAQAQAGLAAAEARADLLDDMTAAVAVGLGDHGAAQLAAQSEMAERLRGARQVTVHTLAGAVAERDRCHRGAQRLELQQQRLIERRSSHRDEVLQSVKAPLRQRLP